MILVSLLHADLTATAGIITVWQFVRVGKNTLVLHLTVALNVYQARNVPWTKCARISNVPILAQDHVLPMPNAAL